MFLRKAGQINLDNQIAQMAMQSMGFGPVGEIRMLSPGSGNAHNYYRALINEANFHTFISKAEEAMVTNRNDVCLVLPGSHPWRGDDHATAAVLTWDKTNTHLLGLDPAPLAGYNRSRFSHSGYAMANFMTVSGDCNLFKNLRWMHGSATGAGADVTCITVSGHGNRFENCAFAGPNDATQAADADYAGVVVTGTQNHFKNCVFGSVNDIRRSGANCMLSLNEAAMGFNIFENCLFKSRADAGTPYFINDASAAVWTDFTAIFLNCQFLNLGTSLVLGIEKAANTARTLYFDNRCTFIGVDDIVADARNGEVYWGAAGSMPDTQATNDHLFLGIGQTPIHTAD